MVVTISEFAWKILSIVVPAAEYFIEVVDIDRIVFADDLWLDDD